MNKIFKVILASLLIIGFSNTTSAQEVQIPEKYKVHLDFSHITQNLAFNYKKIINKVGNSKTAKAAPSKTKFKHSLKVRASAYNSLVGQTDRTPSIAAWGDRLKPGMKVIAVSRDLLTKYGLKHNTEVKIKGLPGTYRVKDKMNKRFRKKIDIYMGNSRRKALNWGRRNVTIMW